MTLFTSSVASFFLRITRKLKKIAWPSDDVSKDICLPGCCCSQHTFTSFSYIVIVSQYRFPFRKYRVRMYSKMGRKVKRDRASWVFSLGRGPFEFYCLWESQQQLLKSPELNCSKKTSWGNEGKRFKYQEKDLEVDKEKAHSNYPWDETHIWSISHPPRFRSSSCQRRRSSFLIPQKDSPTQAAPVYLWIIDRQLSYFIHSQTCKLV